MNWRLFGKAAEMAIERATFAARLARHERRSLRLAETRESIKSIGAAVAHITPCSVDWERWRREHPVRGGSRLSLVGDAPGGPPMSRQQRRAAARSGR
jgi:hypothetical protein